MPNLTLSLHPDSRSPAMEIEAEIQREPSGLLQLSYQLSAALDEVRLPSFQTATRSDELWKHTCFELFLQAANGYYEFNFSPSSQWAAYRFNGYRAGMRDAEMNDPLVTWREEADRGTLTATLDLPHDVTGPLGLSAVIETNDDIKSYWALAHPAGPPDFHNAACFVATLPPAG